jgi:hypothetical protein
MLATAGCSKPAVPKRTEEQVQVALDELRKLRSCAEVPLSRAEFSERFLASKVVIDLAVDRTTDKEAGRKVQEALSYYGNARTAWGNEYLVRRNLLMGAEAAEIAKEYAVADDHARGEFDIAGFERLDKVVEKIDADHALIK